MFAIDHLSNSKATGLFSRYLAYSDKIFGTEV